MATYKLKTTRRTALPRNNRLREVGGGTSSTSVVTVNTGGVVSPATEHFHANKAYLDQITTDAEGYQYLTMLRDTIDAEGNDVSETITEKVKAGYADEAGTIAPDKLLNLPFLSKVEDDVAKGNITFEKMIEVLGGLFGPAWNIGYSNGSSSMTIDNLFVKKKAIFDALAIKHLEHVGGEFMLTPAGAKATSVKETIAGAMPFDAIEEIDATGAGSDDTIVPTRIIYVPSLRKFVGEVQKSGVLRPSYYLAFKGSEMYGNIGSAYYCDDVYYFQEGSRLAETDTRNAYRCYIQTDDGADKVINTFKYADQVICKTFNVDAERQRYYWRRCVGVGEDYIDLSMSQCDTSVDNDVPLAGDSMVTLGNDSDVDRQNAIIISSYGDLAPSIVLYKGINSFSLYGKDDIQISPKGNRLKGEITLDAETTTIKTGDKEIAVFTTNDEGNAVIKAELIDAEQLSVAKLNTKPSNKPHISIEGEQVQIYDADNKVKVKLHGGKLSKASGTDEVSLICNQQSLTLNENQRYARIILNTTALVVEDTTMLYQMNTINTVFNFTPNVASDNNPIPTYKRCTIQLVRYYTPNIDANFDIDTAEDYEVLGTFETGWEDNNIKTFTPKFSVPNTTYPVGSYKFVLELSINTSVKSGLFKFNPSVEIVGSPILNLQEIAEDGFNFQYGDATKYVVSTADGFEVRHGSYGIRVSETNGAVYTTDGFQTTMPFGSGGGGEATYPVITATASVDNISGTPKVNVTKSGGDSNPTFTFAFSGLKGETGAKGDKGDKGDSASIIIK